ncbi:hypothetical protein ACFLZ9_00765 [Patescibacteria group bacterium]
MNLKIIKKRKGDIIHILLSVLPATIFLFRYGTPFDLGMITLFLSFSLMIFVFIMGIRFFIWGINNVILRIKQKNYKAVVTPLLAMVFGCIIIFYFYLATNSWQRSGHPSYTRVLMDVKQIQTALEIFRNDMGHYPTTKLLVFNKDSKYCLGDQSKQGFAQEGKCTSRVYMALIPPGRQGKRRPKICPEYINYIYRVADDFSSFTIEYCIEEDQGGVKKGVHYATPKGLADP